MTQRSSTPPGDTPYDSASSEGRGYEPLRGIKAGSAQSGAALPRRAPEYIAGTPEHTALVAAVLREFPEIKSLRAPSKTSD
jgi:hypothetical protein